MGYFKPRKRAKGNIKTIDPKPIWEVEVQKAGESPIKMYMTTEKAEPYFKAGFPVKLRTKAGELKEYD